MTVVYYDPVSKSVNVKTLRQFEAVDFYNNYAIGDKIFIGENKTMDFFSTYPINASPSFDIYSTHLWDLFKYANSNALYDKVKQTKGYYDVGCYGGIGWPSATMVGV